MPDAPPPELPRANRLKPLLIGMLAANLVAAALYFGITLMLVDPAFSSHFDSRTGLPGVRVNQETRDFEQRYPYAKWAKDTKKTGGPTKLAELYADRARALSSLCR